MLFEPAGGQAEVGEGGLVALRHAVERSDRGRFTADIEHLGGLVDHPPRGIERGDPGGEFGVAMSSEDMVPVDLLEQALLQLAQGRRTLRRVQVRDRLRAGNDPDALMDRRQETAVPDLRSRVGQMLAEHHVRGQVRVEGSQAVAQPCAQAGKGQGGRAGMHGQNGLEMLDDVGVQRPDHAELVGDLAQAGKEVADQKPRLPVALEAEGRSQERPASGLVGPQPERGDGLAMLAIEPRLAVERVTM